MNSIVKRDKGYLFFFPFFCLFSPFLWFDTSVILFFCLFSKVVLKIIKHYQEEGQGSEVVQGVLLGLVVEDRLEITNCFPFPQHTEDDADFDEGKWKL